MRAHRSISQRNGDHVCNLPVIAMDDTDFTKNEQFRNLWRCADAKCGALWELHLICSVCAPHNKIICVRHIHMIGLAWRHARLQMRLRYQLKNIITRHTVR